MTDSNTAEEQSSYFIAEEDTSNLLFQFIRKESINKKYVACFADLTARFESYMKENGFTVDKMSKKELRKRVKDEFVATANIFQNNEGRLIILTIDLSREDLAVEVTEWKNN